MSLSCSSAGSKLIPGERDLILANLGVEYYLLADAYFEIGKYVKSVELYQKVLKTGAKTDEEIQFKIARAAALAKNWNLALEHYTALSKLDPQNASLLKSVAWIYGQKGDLIAARTEYAKLYELYSYDKDICVNYIFVLAALDNLETAEEIFKSYSNLYPDTAELADLEKLVYPDKKDEPQQKNTEIKKEPQIQDTRAGESAGSVTN